MTTAKPLNLVRNTQKEALTSTLTVDELGKAMAQLDLSTIPHHKHADAIRDHLLRIMAETIHDRTVAVEIHAARHMRAQRASGLIGITPSIATSPTSPSISTSPTTPATNPATKAPQ